MNSALRPTLVDVSTNEPNSGSLLGRQLGGRYDVFDFVGAGGMGEVYRARDLELDEVVAIKTLHAHVARSEELLTRLRREVRLARRVTHPCVARVYELHDLEGLRFVTMEYVEGEPLSALLEREGRLGSDTVARIGALVGRALQAAHDAGVIHRDVKPDNVLAATDGRIAITDFGIAFSLEEMHAETSGTPAYMAPEQVRGEAVTSAADVYALGATLFELATGALPFAGETALAMMIARLDASPPDPRSVAPVDDSLAEVILHAMAAAPGDRIASASQLADALEPLSARRVVVPVRPRVLAPETSTLVALAPFDRFDAAPELGGALREELLLRLPRLPRVRLAASTTEADVEIHARRLAEERVGIEVLRSEDAESWMSARLPLAGDRVGSLAGLVLDSIALALGLPPSAPVDVGDVDSEVERLCQRARGAYRTVSNADYSSAVALYAQALELAPSHPVALAGHAMATLRHAFFSPDGCDLERARVGVERAMNASPGRPEPPLAAGHLALHEGRPVDAARHFRQAVRRAPGWAEGHEWLGRMLLEAGFVRDGVARIDAAIARDPGLVPLRWEVARAAALEGHWSEVSRELAVLERHEGSLGARWLGLLRLASWRGDRRWLAALGEGLVSDRARVFEPTVGRALLAVSLDPSDGEAWKTAKHHLEARAFAEHPSRRRTVFFAQLACDFGSLVGDVPFALRALEHADAEGLFDWHWLDRSPHLHALRHTKPALRVRERVAQRAETMRNALFDS